MLFHSNKQSKGLSLYLIKLVIALLSLTSLFCTVLMLYSLTDKTLWSGIVAVSAGLGLQIGMYSVPVFASKYWHRQGKRMLSVCCWMATLLLFSVSVISSTTVFDDAIRKNQVASETINQARVSDSALVATKKEQIKLLQDQVASMSVVFDKLSAGSYQTKALEVSDKIAKLNKEISVAISQYSQLVESSKASQKKQSENAQSWYYSSFGGRLVVLFAFALLIDGLCLVSIIVASVEDSEIESTRFIKAERGFVNHKSDVKSDSAEATDPVEINNFDTIVMSDGNPHHEADIVDFGFADIADKSSIQEESSDTNIVDLSDFNADPNFNLCEPELISAQDVPFIVQHHFSDEQREIYGRIKNKTYDKPVITKVVEDWSISRDSARDVFNVLVAEGVIKLTHGDRRYAYVA